MRKILLVGKFNETVKDINSFLSDYFQVQLCSENMEMAVGMLKIVKPDIVIISLIGLYDVDDSIFYALSEQYSHIPVLTIGTENECSRYLKYYEEEQFENLVRPVSNTEILEKCLERVPKEEVKKGKPHILVVDDSAVQLRTMKKMLDEKYSVAVATSGSQAMTAIGRKRPDLILLDYEMPVCDGKMTFEMIRADKELQEIPVIFLTGISDKAHIEAVLKLKPAGYFLKPAVEEDLLKAIEKVLDQ